ncbi:PBPe domain-containing protein [Abeliophyllum distichum]|uniref:PBPe domain-containing protein n=1 Tax=Abeliophyllum distichum TaxID=126358 RepID=A0ABD1ULV3_9LAMI
MLLLGLRIWKHYATIKSMSRFGDHRKLFKGPLYYASTVTLACVIYWRSTTSVPEMLFCKFWVAYYVIRGFENVGAAIEYDLILPPFSSLSDPEGFVRQEAAKLISKQSQVFIVLQLSLPLATGFFRSSIVGAKAVKELGRDNTSNPRLLLNEIQSNNFIGLSGEIRFHDGKLEQKSTFRIVNIVGKSMNELSSLVNWPGELDRVPKGWAMPTDAVPMKIGFPGNNSFPMFVKVEWD